MFERTIQLVGQENFDKIKSKTVAVIGLGGVGGYAVESLIRTGIQNIILVDYDKIDITNLNRQIITNSSNIGKLKTKAFEDRILSINNLVNVTIINEYLTQENLDKLFNLKIDYIIDACDTVLTKELLIKESLRHNVKIISSMGMGNKLHPEDLEIIDIRKTSYDPIAKKIRKFIKDEGIKEKVNVVYSKEQPKQHEGVISSMSFVPGVAGLLCASYVINDIIS